jgi:hypothetical protein
MEYRSEHLIGIPKKKFGDFFDFPKSFSKHRNKGPRGPNTSFYYSNVLVEKMKNFDLGTPEIEICTFFLM